MERPAKLEREWLRHGYIRTYNIAHFIEQVATNPMAYIRDLLQGITANDEILAYLAPWQKQSALHRFSMFIADALFYDDLDGPVLWPLDPDDPNPTFVLPVDYTLFHYGLSHPFILPQTMRDEPATPSIVEDRYFDYFQDLRISGPYEALLDRIADEVFYVMFPNRAALAALNEFLASIVAELPVDYLVGEGSDDLVALFSSDGQLKRRRPPEWAKRAVFFRDRGRCVVCGADLTGLVNSLPAPNFDHMFPLKRGGLNDVTNLQLLCATHNKAKGGRIEEADPFYLRWYPKDVGRRSRPDEAIDPMGF